MKHIPFFAIWFYVAFNVWAWGNDARARVPLAPTPARITLGQQTPNILLVVLDDVGWYEWVLLDDSLGALADEGTTFLNFYAFPACSPTRYAYRTGRMPRRQPTLAVESGALVTRPGGIGDLAFNAHNPTADRVPLDCLWLPEVMAASHTTALVGKAHLGRVPLLGVYDDATTGIYEQGWNTLRAVNPVVLNQPFPDATGYYDWLRVDDGAATYETEWATAVQVEEALALMASLPEPWLIELSLSAPHDPFDTPPGGFPGATSRARYEDLLADADERLGALLAQVDLLDTYVLAYTDNGTPDAQGSASARPLGTAAGRWKGSLYQGGVHVPLVVAGPGVPENIQTDRLVACYDIPATVAELAGVCLPPGRFEDSQSFASELGVGTAPERAWLAVERYEVIAANAYPQPAGYDGVAVVMPPWKLIRHDPDGAGPGGFVEEFYHLTTDPGETTPRLPPFTGVQYPNVWQNAWNQAQAHMASIPARAQ